MTYNEEKFKEHIKAVVEASYADEDTLQERPLTLSELKELAISMGLTDEEWDKLLEKANTHLKAADDHLKKRNFTEAIAEAEKATAINPYISNGNAVLAKAYMMLWLESHNDEHRDKAESHARKELKVDPRDQVAVNVLSTIDKKRKILAGEDKDRKKIFVILGVILIVVVGMAIFYGLSGQAEKENSNSSSIDASERDQIKDDLIVAEENVLAQWDMVQIQIDRRNKLVPDLLAVINSSEGDAEALNQTIEELKSQIKNAEGEEKFKLMNDLDTKITEMKELANANADGDNIKALMVQIEGCENRIAYEKKNYNDAVKEYNILAKKHNDKFPEYEVKPYWSNH